MSEYLDNASDIALFILIFSASLSLLNNPAVGVGDAMGVEKNLNTPTKDQLGEAVSEKKDMEPNQSLDFFFKRFMVAFQMMGVVFSIPFAIFSTITNIIPGALGIAFGTLFQLPANLIMVIGLGRFIRG